MRISFAFRLLIRTFGLRPKVLSLGKAKKSSLFFCFSLAYSYLCKKNRRYATDTLQEQQRDEELS
jgi:hypothetical protein